MKISKYIKLLFCLSLVNVFLLLNSYSQIFVQPERLDFNELSRITSDDFLYDYKSKKIAIIRSNPLNFSVNVEMKDSLPANSSKLFTLENHQFIKAKFISTRLNLLTLAGDVLCLTRENSSNTIILDSNVLLARINVSTSELLNLENNKIAVLFNSKVYMVENGTVTLLDEFIDDIIAYKNKLYLLKNQTSSLKFIEYDGDNISEFMLAPTQNSSLFAKGKFIFIVSNIGDNFKISSFSTGTKIFLDIDIHVRNNNLFDFPKSENGKDIVFYQSTRLEARIQGKTFEEEVPTDYGEIIGLKYIGNNIIIYSKSKIIIFDDELNYLGKHEMSNVENLIEISDGLMIIKSETASIVISFDYNEFWLLRYIITNYYYVFLYIALIFSFLYVYNRLQQKNIILKTLLDLPSSGMVLTFNQNGRLLSINNLGRKYLKMTDSIPLGQFFENYLKVEEYGELRELIRKSIKLKDNFNQKISLVFNNNVVELYCTINSIITKAGFYKGFVITAVDITEELERKRMSNWAQLAHDMQTNLSTIRLNAEQLDLETDNRNNSRRKKIIHQTNILLQRVRDIVTVGRSSKIAKLSYHSREIVSDLISEFDQSINKNIMIASDVENFSLKCDKVKLISAMRNAVENAIKAINGNKGNIIVKVRRDNRFVYFTISDDGPGMDDIVRNSMTNPFFTTGEDTENSSSKGGGTGIGSIIMQNVAEQHGGELVIKSSKGKGTEIIFKLPYLRN